MTGRERGGATSRKKFLARRNRKINEALNFSVALSRNACPLNRETDFSSYTQTRIFLDSTEWLSSVFPHFYFPVSDSLFSSGLLKGKLATKWRARFLLLLATECILHRRCFWVAPRARSKVCEFSHTERLALVVVLVNRPVIDELRFAANK